MSEPQPLVVLGGTVKESRQYCADEALGLGLAVIVASLKGLATLDRQKRRVRLIGTFHTRKDAVELLGEIRRRGWKLEDRASNV